MRQLPSEDFHGKSYSEAWHWEGLVTYLRLYVCRWCYDVTGNAFWTRQLLLQWVLPHPSSLFYLNSILAVGWKSNVSQEQNTFFFVKENLWALACLHHPRFVSDVSVSLLSYEFLNNGAMVLLCGDRQFQEIVACVGYLFTPLFMHPFNALSWSTYPELTLCQFWRHTVNEDMVLTSKEYL